VLLGWLRTHLDPAAAGRASVGAISLPRVLAVTEGRLHQEPAAEVAALRHDRATARLEPGQAATSLTSWQRTAAAEILLDAAVPEELLSTTVVLGDSSSGASHAVDLAVFAVPSTWIRVPGSPGRWEPDAAGTAAHEARIIIDGGIVEVFLDDGRAAAFSDLRIENVDRVEIRRSLTAGSLEVVSWLLG
jgi:sucrose-6-phosphate hydrolase SacC (GH32 family)